LPNAKAIKHSEASLRPASAEADLLPYSRQSILGQLRGATVGNSSALSAAVEYPTNLPIRAASGQLLA